MKITPEENAELTKKLERHKIKGLSILQTLGLVATLAILVIVIYELIN